MKNSSCRTPPKLAGAKHRENTCLVYPARCFRALGGSAANLRIGEQKDNDDLGNTTLSFAGIAVSMYQLVTIFLAVW